MLKNKDLNFFHKTPIQIRFNDIDIMAHVNNSVYQNYFDLARTQYFEEVFEEHITWKLRALVLAKITIEYIQPVFLEENIIVQSKVYKIGNKSLQMKQKIVNGDTNEIKAINEAVLVSFGTKEEKTIEMPEDWRSKIAKFENDINF